MTAPNDQDEWSQEDILTLTETMKARLPANDDKMYKITQSHLDWDKVAFKDYTGPMCRQKWNEISNQIRKCRTLTEMILDAEEHVKNPYEGKKILNHPDFPKKPQKPYNRFFFENKAKYKKLEPDMRHGDIDKMLTLIYKELPEETKNKYVEDYLREKQEFDSKLAKFREEHPDLIQSTKKSETPKTSVPKTPKTAIPETPKAAVPVKTKAAVPVKTKAAVPVKTKAAVPVKTKAAVPVKTKAAVPVKTKAAVTEKTKVAVAEKTKVAVAEKLKTPQQLKSSAKQKTADSAKKRKPVTPSKTPDSHRKMKRSKMSL